MTAHFLVERDGPTALLTFNRPDARNSMTFEMYEALHDACATLDTDPTVWNDLGNLMLASVMFWAYLSLSQLLLIWSGNLTEEIPWYLRRSQGGWQIIAWLLGVCYFALPFLALLSRRLKRDPRGLMAIGGGLVVLSVVHQFWLVNPVYAARAAESYAAYGPLSLHWLDVAALAGLGGTTFSCFLWQLRAWPLTPRPNPLPAEEGVASHASNGNRKKALLGKCDQHGQVGPAVDVL